MTLHDLNDDTLLTVNEAASLLTCSASILNKMRVAGRGPAYIKLGRHVRYQVCDLRAWLEAQRRSATSDKAIA